MVTVSLALGGRLKVRDALSFMNHHLPIVRKEGVYIWNSAQPTANPELCTNGQI